jgi:hypothetical protein
MVKFYVADVFLMRLIGFVLFGAQIGLKVFGGFFGYGD